MASRRVPGSCCHLTSTVGLEADALTTAPPAAAVMAAPATANAIGTLRHLPRSFLLISPPR
jgi:hypothetical protein